MKLKARRLRVAGERTSRAFSSLRAWLRRVMPRVALAAVALFVLRLLLRGTGVYDTSLGGFVRGVAFVAVCGTLSYYGLKLLVRLKRMLLWRVRRRLVITYLSVGLTPIVLLVILGVMAAMGSGSQGVVRVVTAQVGATERQTRETARALAVELLKPSGADAARTREREQAWLDERVALVRAALPGARVDVWRAATPAEVGQLGQDAEAQLTGGTEDERTRGVGVVADTPGAALPAWLRGRDEWSGVSYLPPPENSASAFGTPSLRALVRRADAGRAVAVLVTVPFSRALVEHYRETTGVNVRPFFLGAEQAEVKSEDGNVTLKGDLDEDDAGGTQREGSMTFKSGGREVVVEFKQDQFGEPLPGWFPVFLNATNWQSGVESARWAFMLDWSWASVWKQFWSDNVFGPFWWRLLYGAAVTFLVLELLALFSAAWMTRAVTGTVHKLYRATQFIKRGDFSHRIRTRSRDQLGELALAFNDMSANIEALLADRVERERLEREIEIAHDVQAQFFPRSVPELSTAEITGECRAARGVSGDYYDYVEVAPGLIAFALGDVSGKGLSAALVMSNLQASLRAQAAIISERLRLAGLPAASASSASSAVAAGTAAPNNADGATMTTATTNEVMPCGVTGVDTACAVSNMAAAVNAQICSSTEGNRFVTLFLALYDDRARTLRYTNAGHNAPALVRPDGAVERLTRGGTMIGAFDWATFEEAQTTLGDGDLLLIFSDGLSEARNHAGEEYGEERLVRFAAARRASSAEEVRRAVFDELDIWTGGAERDDDQTLVILKAATGK